MMKKFGKILRIKRKKRGLTQEDLAKKIGVCLNSICLWERGLAVPGLTSLINLADVFKCSIDELAGRG
jgi:transcriptional regulator with XRE-family HTH domain